MKIDKDEKIADQPILRIRDMLRFAGRSSFGKEFVAHRCDVSLPQAEKIIRELRKRELIKPLVSKDQEEPGVFLVAAAGLRLINFRAVARISRAKAKTLLVAFLERCDEVDRRDELAYYVAEVKVFGSYASREQKDLGDIDLLTDIKQRPIEGRDIIKYSEERARASGRRFPSWLAELDYAEREVRQILKNRSPYIALHIPSDPVAAAAKGKVIFRSKRFPLPAPNKSRRI